MLKKFILVTNIAIILLSIATLTTGAAGASFTLHLIEPSLFANCTAIDTADINTDGHIDVIAADRYGTIKWWKNQGNGQFSSLAAASITFNFSWASTLVAADFDQDGDTDVAAFSKVNKRLAWFENQGSGNWKMWDNLKPNSISPHILAPDPIDKEGIPQILGGFGNSVYFLQLTPDETTGYKASSGLYTWPKLSNALHAGDVDRNGEPDILAGLNDNTIRLGMGLPFTRSIWLQSGDLDRDGDPDLVAASDTLGLFWWEQKNSNNWIRHKITRHDVYLAESLELVDMDNDGDLDLVGSTTTTILWWENLGRPTQAGGWVRRVIASEPSLTKGFSLSTADIDGDGQMDVVSCPRQRLTNPMAISWWENKRQPVPASAIQFGPRRKAADILNAWGVDVADMDGDGWADIIGAGVGVGTNTGDTGWWHNPGDVTQIPWPNGFKVNWDGGHGVTAYSMGWGRPQYVVSGQRVTGEIWQMVGNDWNWSSVLTNQLVGNLGNSYFTAIADIYVDGRADIIYTSPISDTIHWIPSEMGSPQTPSRIASNCNGAWGVTGADFDSDGDADVAATCSNEANIRWWANNDLSSWTNNTVTLAGIDFSGAHEIRSGDMDGDGRAEMVVYNPAHQGIVWLKPNATLNDGTTMGWISTSISDTQHIEIIDVDRDGKLDVVATSPSREEMYWFRNEITDPASCYTGCFTAYKQDESMTGVYDLALGDLNHSGRPDIVAAVGHEVWWYEQYVDVEVYLDQKVLGSGQSATINGGESIAYDIQITNNSLSAANADIVLVDTWQPPDAVIAASGPGCVAAPTQGVMTCTLTVDAGHIETLPLIITPSLLYDGYITNTATLSTEPSFFNLVPPQDKTATAPPVQVNKDPNLYDLLIKPGSFPTESISPGEYFEYSVTLSNQGPAFSPAGATMINQWSPASAIDSFQGYSFSGASLSAQTHTCDLNSDEGAVICYMDGIDAGETVTVTVGITTSHSFTDVLECELSVEGDENEGIPSNNTTWPIRVGSTTMYDLYLPLIFKND